MLYIFSACRVAPVSLIVVYFIQSGNASCFAYLFVFMSYGRSDTILGDSESILSYNQIKELVQRYTVISLGKFNFQLPYSSDGLYIGFFPQPVRLL